MMNTRNNLISFQEPKLEFRYGQEEEDPRMGLSIYGPYDADLPSQPKGINYLLVGTEEGITQFKGFSPLFNSPVSYAPRDNHRLWYPYPGFELAFGSLFPESAVYETKLDTEKLLDSSRLYDPYSRAYAVVNQFLRGFTIQNKLDEKIDIAICIVPDEVFRNCRPESRVSQGTGEKTKKRDITSRKSGQTELFADNDFSKYNLSPDFRRQLKARAMKFGIPVQIIRESTLRPGDESKLGARGLTPLSDRLWNLATGIYYKAGGKPWKLQTAREGVCYIGIAFRRTGKEKNSRTACCAAQMFLNNGDGVVFLGEYGPWYSPSDKQFRLPQKSAKKLLEGVLSTYEELHGQPLQEIFLHSRSFISEEEYKGYMDACPEGVNLTGIRVRVDRFGPRLYRSGKMAILRGTFWKINRSSGLLWGSGFKAKIGTFDGWETPVPMRIDILYGDTEVERVAQDILGLTKLNFNACHLGDSEPVTVGFSDAIGEILISNPEIKDRRANFKYYI